MSPHLLLLLLLGLRGALGDRGAQPLVETDTCRQHVVAYQIGLAASELWALNMFDSATKLPSGLLYGNIVQLGNFDECLAAAGPGFTGRWCRAQITDASVLPVQTASLAHQLMLLPVQRALVQAAGRQENTASVRSGMLPPGAPAVQWAVCAPSSCGPEGVAEVAAFNLAQLGVAVTADVVNASCFANGDPEFALDAASWGAISLILLLVVVAAASTLYEYLVVLPSDSKPPHAALLAFSLRGNLTQLFRVPRRAAPGTLTCVHGIRVLSLAWVVLGHRYYIQFYMPNINVTDLLQYAEHWSNMVVVNSFLSVETFFFLSGLFASYVACNNQKRGRSFSLLQYYVYRYVRLTAPLAVYVFFVAALSDRITHGPLWDLTVIPEAAGCRSNWWAALLYVNNYVDDTICGGQTWYLSVDMQLSWLAPLLLLPLLRWPRPTLAAILVLTLASTAAVFATSYINELFWTNPLTAKVEIAIAYWAYLYGNTPMRAAPYLLGMALGHVLSSCRKVVWPWWAWLGGWAVSATACLSVVFTLALAYHPDYEYSRLDAAFYGSLHRVAWSLGVGWVIYACVHGQGGPVNRFLSWRFFEPLSKLTYCAFLTHYIIIFMDGGSWRNPNYFSNFNAVHAFLGDVFLVVAASLALYLLVEAPVSILLRSLLGKDLPSSLGLKDNNGEQGDKKDEDARTEVKGENNASYMASETQRTEVKGEDTASNAASETQRTDAKEEDVPSSSVSGPQDS